MLLKYFYDNPLAQASYMIGCQETGQALVIDPMRDIRLYLQAAQDEGLRITQVTETHIHADFVSGARELAAATGARLYLSDMGDNDWKYGVADVETVLLRDGDVWRVGTIRVEALHTPGHTPEHLIFQITDTAGADEPMGLFSGDCLFVGNIGRPDLLDEAAGYSGTAVIGARQQYANVQRLKTLPDYLQIWPGHGAGSACGKGLGAVPSSTLGYEKRFNPAFQFSDEAVFVTWLLEEQPEVPHYFAQMKQVNKGGAALLASLKPAAHLAAGDLGDAEASGLVIDTRSVADFARQHVPGTLNVPLESDRFNTHVGRYVDYQKPVYVIVEEGALERVLELLRAIGVDDVPGYFAADVVQGYSGSIAHVTVQEAGMLLRQGEATLLDVRGLDEYNTRHIPGARHIPMGEIPARMDELPREQPLIVQCGGGLRSQVVASLLQRAGFTNIHNLLGGIDGWKQAGLPLEEG